MFRVEYIVIWPLGLRSLSDFGLSCANIVMMYRDKFPPGENTSFCHQEAEYCPWYANIGYSRLELVRIDANANMETPERLSTRSASRMSSGLQIVSLRKLPLCNTARLKSKQRYESTEGCYALIPFPKFLGESVALMCLTDISQSVSR